MSEQSLSIADLQAMFDSGNQIDAAKALRGKLGCGLKDALDALKSGRAAEALDFQERNIARRRLEDAAPDLLAALKSVQWSGETALPEGGGAACFDCGAPKIGGFHSVDCGVHAAITKATGAA